MCDDDNEECCCPKKYADRCFVISVVTLISFCYVSYWYLIIVPWKLWTTGIGWLNLIGLHTTFSLLCICYYKTMWTPAGYVQKGWRPEGTPESQVKASEQQHQELVKSGKKAPQYFELEMFYQPRWCPHCRGYKPPRSHHCKDLNVCVQKMDHYCPWVYNAVGYRNHKFFIQFLFYASVSLTYFLICCLVRIVLVVQSSTRGRFQLGLDEIILFIIQLVLTLPVTIGIISLLCYQLSCLWNNLTSIETFAFKRFKRGARVQNIQNFVWFYDYGISHNFRDVLGPTVLEWFIPRLPDHVVNGDGMTFRTRDLSAFGLVAKNGSTPETPTVAGSSAHTTVEIPGLRTRKPAPQEEEQTTH